MTARILTGDCREVLATMPAESVDAIVTDPPYDLTAGKKGGTGAASLNPNSPAGRSRISTGGTVLDPFAGSGSTLKAAVLEGFDCIGVELMPEHVAIAQARVAHAEATVARERADQARRTAQAGLFAEVAA